ncbi:nucleotidyl transferase AbiEii/AbiGii toxin family protein [Paraglaciecola sp.]|uniref:nucleotidyl transferase AbiEii/AbiGii toxin family protein n=1 Tax=Paraglaciecola sp. TaxID=1920173 RepID=UPI0030F3981A
MLNKLVEGVLLRNEKLNGLADVVEKEILHHDILIVLQKAGILQNLTFIGGTALRVCYRSNRLSEDLDFTAGADFKASSLAGMGDHLRDYLSKKYGLNVAVHEPTLSNTDTSTWKITIEKFPNRPDLPSQKMHIDICALPSFEREFRPAIDHYDIQSPIAGLPIPVQSKQEILADKMVAFAFRARRIKPRDVWDIAWLKQGGIEQNAKLIAQKLEVRNKTISEYVELTEKHAVMLKNDPTTKKDFEQEMSRFLPSDIAQNTLKNANFWPYVGQVVYEDVQQVNSELRGEAKNSSMKM